MFTITVDGWFKVGDTREVNVNGEPTTLTFTDPGTLTLGDGSVRKISYINCTLDSQTFVCAEGATMILPVQTDDIPS